MKKITCMQTFNEYIWACLPESSDNWGKCTVSLKLHQTQRAWLCKGQVGYPVTCWLVRMHLNDRAHPIRYEFMFVCTPLKSEFAFWRKLDAHISILRAEASWSFACSPQMYPSVLKLTDKNRKLYPLAQHCIQIYIKCLQWVYLWVAQGTQRH